MGKPRKFRHAISWGGDEWSVDEFVTSIGAIVATIPAEYQPSAKVELVVNEWPEEGTSVCLAVTAVMTDSFDYTDSGWEPA